MSIVWLILVCAVAVCCPEVWWRMHRSVTRMQPLRENHLVSWSSLELEQPIVTARRQVSFRGKVIDSDRKRHRRRRGCPRVEAKRKMNLPIDAKRRERQHLRDWKEINNQINHRKQYAADPFLYPLCALMSGALFLA